MNDRLVLAEILYIYLNHESCGWTSPDFWDRVWLRQVQRFLDFTEDIEYDGSLHGDLPLDESPYNQPLRKRLFSIHDWLGMPNKSWVILESKLLPWAEIDFSDFCLRIFKLDIFTVVAGWSLHFIADLRGFSPMCVLAFDPLMCHLVSCKLWTVKQQWKSGGKVAGEFVFSIVTPNTKRVSVFHVPCFFSLWYRLPPHTLVVSLFIREF